jgi:hypothetical protein
MMRKQYSVAAMVACLLTAGLAYGGQAPEPTPAREPSTCDAVPLKVQIVVSRYQGDKKIASLPYVLGVATGSKTSLRMGVEVPVVTTMAGPNMAGPTSYSYRDVGTNIDCYAEMAGAGNHKLMITVSDSSIHLDASKSPQRETILANAPAFRTFNSSFTVLLKDGQTTQYTSATDPVTGEVMKIDVTLNVMR